MSLFAASVWLTFALAQHQHGAAHNHSDATPDAAHAMHAQKPTVIRVCTAGSFVEAINSVNGGSKAIELLLASRDAKAVAALKEVQALVVIALGRVSAELQCGEDLDASYQESYRVVLQKALNQARAGHLPTRAKDLAESALAALKGL
jgi:hypothetical protein